MLPPLHAWLTGFLTRHRLRRAFWLGTPYRATITATTSMGYLLAIHHTNGTEWLPLGPRTGDDDHPTADNLRTAVAALTARRLALVLPWDLDAHGNLTATLTTGKEATP